MMYLNTKSGFSNINFKTSSDEFLLADRSLSEGIGTGEIISTKEISFFKNKNHILVKTDNRLDNLQFNKHLKGLIIKSHSNISHLVIIGRSLGIPILAFSNLKIKKDCVYIKGVKIDKNEELTIDGTKGGIIKNLNVCTNKSQFKESFYDRNVDEIIGDKEIFLNIDSRYEFSKLDQFNVTGIGGCRLEHLFITDGKTNLLKDLLGKTDNREGILSKSERFIFEIATYFLNNLPERINVFCIRLLDISPKEIGLCKIVCNKGKGYIKRKLFNDNDSRGVRLALYNPEIYQTLIRGVLKAIANTIRQSTDIYIIIPFVVFFEEVNFVKNLIKLEVERLGLENLTSLKIGCMIETPNSLFIINKLAENLDCLLVGSNDLIQYTYLASRNDYSQLEDVYKKNNILEKESNILVEKDNFVEIIGNHIKKAKNNNPNVKIGICGELATEIDFFRQLLKYEVDFYVSNINRYRQLIASLVS